MSDDALTDPLRRLARLLHDAGEERWSRSIALPATDAGATRPGTPLRQDVEHLRRRRAARLVDPADRHTAWTEYEACGRVTARHRPGSGTARCANDAAGHLKESSDTWCGHRRFRYDAAGQHVEVVTRNGGATR